MNGKWTQGSSLLGAATLCLAFFILAGSLESASEPMGRRQGYLVTTAGQGRNAALAQAGGEFRVVAANLLWSKVVDHYHHQYMAQGGNWAKNASLLPLLQTIITLDPHFVQAYQVMGAAILPHIGEAERGEKVLADGIAHNPNSWELYRDMAITLSWSLHYPKQALPYAEKGLACADDDFSRNILTKLCKTLKSQIAEQAKA